MAFTICNGCKREISTWVRKCLQCGACHCTRDKTAFRVKAILWTSAAWFLFASTAFATGQLMDLGILPGYPQTHATHISPDGTTVIGMGYSSGIPSHLFRWTEAAGMVDIGTLPGSKTPQVSGVSDDGGVIVGTAWYDDGNSHAFRWTQATDMVDLGTFGGFYSQASAVSADGSVVVGTVSDSMNYPQAFRWTEDTGMVYLGVLQGVDHYGSEASSISADGQVIVGSSDGNLCSRGFRWTQAEGMVDLGSPFGGSRTYPLQVSKNGSVISGWFGETWDSNLFRWTPEGGIVDLGTLPGFYNSYPQGMSENGDVIAGYALNHNPQASRTFRWTAATGMIDLQAPTGTDSQVSVVSADGSIIIGSISDPTSGRGDTFRWTAEGGMQTVKDWLTDHGFDTSAFEGYDVAGISADGTVVAGNMYDERGNRRPYYAKVIQGENPTLFANVLGNGQGVVTGPGFTCSGGQCSHAFHPGTTVTLTARPINRATFAGWSRCDNSSGNICRVTFKDQDRAVMATFTFSPHIAVSPALLKFGAVRKDGIGSRYITIKNTGPGALIINSVEITGTNASEFFTEGCAAPIAEGSSCKIPVTFSPKSYGVKRAMIQIFSNDVPRSPILVKLAGVTASPPKIYVSPRALSFGSVKIGTNPPVSKIIIVKNIGIDDLVVDSIDIVGDESYSGETTCSIVTKGKSCSITVIFDPSTELLQTGELHIYSNAPVTIPHVALTGRGK